MFEPLFPHLQYERIITTHFHSSVRVKQQQQRVWTRAGNTTILSQPWPHLAPHGYPGRWAGTTLLSHFKRRKQCSLCELRENERRFLGGKRLWRLKLWRMGGIWVWARVASAALIANELLITRQCSQGWKSQWQRCYWGDLTAGCEFLKRLNTDSP